MGRINEKTSRLNRGGSDGWGRKEKDNARIFEKKNKLLESPKGERE